MNIYQRINEVRKKVTYVQKDAKVTGYKAVTHDQVTAALRECMVEFGVITTQSLLESSFRETGDLTAKGNKWMMYQAKYEITFINMEDPNDKFSVTIESQALDNGDKATGKAMSYSMKYAMLKVFNLETGENEEGRQDDFRQKRESKEPLTNEQIALISNLIDESGSDKARFLAFFKSNNLEEMKQSDFDQAVNMLEAKKNDNS